MHTGLTGYSEEDEMMLLGIKTNILKEYSPASPELQAFESTDEEVRKNAIILLQQAAVKFCQKVRKLTKITITRPLVDEFIANYEVPAEVLNTISGVLDKEVEISEEDELRIATNSAKSPLIKNEYDDEITKLQKLIIEINTPEYKNSIVDYRKKAERLLENTPYALTPEHNHRILTQFRANNKEKLIKDSLNTSIFLSKEYREGFKEDARKTYVEAALQLPGISPISVIGPIATTIYAVYIRLAKLRTQYDDLPPALKGHGVWNNMKMTLLCEWGLKEKFLAEEKNNRRAHNRLFAWHYNFEQCIQAIKEVIKEIEALSRFSEEPGLILQQLFLIQNFTLEILEEIISGNINKLIDKSFASKARASNQPKETQIYTSLLKLCLMGSFAFKSTIYLPEGAFIVPDEDFTPNMQDNPEAEEFLKGGKLKFDGLEENKKADALEAMKNYFMHSMIELRESLNTQIAQPIMGLEPESPSRLSNNNSMHLLREAFERFALPSTRIVEAEASNALTNNHISK